MLPQTNSRTFLTLLMFLVVAPLCAQQDSLAAKEKPKNWALSGYVKNMQSLYIIDSLNPVLNNAILLDNLVHHRLNFKWYFHKNWTFKAELRNRIFTGGSLQLLPDYGTQIDLNSSNPLLNPEAWYSPSWLLVNRTGLVIHSMIDRFYLEYVKGNWELRLGRQRINWGINNSWNPHDLFNAYNFTDFDYEERPGADALRVSYYTGPLSKIELAFQAFDRWENINAGFLWQSNKWGYDLQLLTALSYQDLVLGTGWAGHLGQIGFKGEAAWFYPFNDSTTQSLGLSVSGDYLFKNSLMLNFGFLYNSNGSTQADIGNLFAARLSAKNLYPYPFNTMVSFGYPFSPVLSTALTAVYSPGPNHTLFISPMLSYSIKENWDINLLGQLLFNKNPSSYGSPMQILFLRLKWSY